MTSHETEFEIHLHGSIVLNSGADLSDVAEALQPLAQYAKARNFGELAKSLYDDEPGIMVEIDNETNERRLNICWTLAANDDFRWVIDDLCMQLNELAAEGAALEVSFYDLAFDDDEDDEGFTPDARQGNQDGDDGEGSDEEVESRDDFYVVFVGPTPAAIMQVQRDMLVHDVGMMMQRHFDETELGGITAEIDRLFGERLNSLVNSLDIRKVPNPPAQGSHAPRKPRHPH